MQVRAQTLLEPRILIRSRVSLVSAGSERMLVEFGKANLIAPLEIPKVIVLNTHVLAWADNGKRKSAARCNRDSSRRLERSAG